MHNDKGKESLSPTAYQSQDDNLSTVPTEAGDCLHVITEDVGSQDPRQRVLGQLGHEIDREELRHWFVANHGRYPGTATVVFFEAAAFWIEKAYYAGLKGFPLSHAVPWLKSKIDIFGGTENE